MGDHDDDDGVPTAGIIIMVLLLVIMRDTTMEMIARSETDPLSGALNRRGFETHGDRPGRALPKPEVLRPNRLS